MSEYQYYEFQAIDKALSAKEMDDLRAYSTRARITPVSFVNHYHWGDFKGDDDAWMDRYFDAFLYLANWGTRVFKLRLPSKILNLPDTQRYCAGSCFSAREKNGKVVLTFTSEDEDGDDAPEGEGILSSLISIRAELTRGDRRALYLGWLLALQADDIEDDAMEPPVPPGLGDLSAPQKALVEFLRADPDLLHIAAETSAPLTTESHSRGELMTWLATLAPAEKDAWLARVLAEDALSVGAELYRRFQHDHDSRRASNEAQRPRTAGEIRRAAEAHAIRSGRLYDSARGASGSPRPQVNTLEADPGRDIKPLMSFTFQIHHRAPLPRGRMAYSG